ncbi:hypothetical protein ACEXQE_00335 [Herbiconiux sp. P17]|uniref:hypothetical protein n=1 Tax=Herbiconiux wuyangfengii TaxID=3342794 RepID=UPI0035BB72BE
MNTRRDHESENTPCEPDPEPWLDAGTGATTGLGDGTTSTRVFAASPLRLLPSALTGLFRDERETITRLEISDVWVYATMGWHQTFLWHRGQVRFTVSPEQRTITVESFGESVRLSCPYFSRALMTELRERLADRF